MYDADLTVAYVLGNGPTLPVEHLHLLEGEFTVGVNHILRSGFAPKVLFWWDRATTLGDPDFYEKAKASPCVLVAGDRGCHRGVADHTLPHARPGDEDLVSDFAAPHRYVVRGDSGCAAVRWCYGLGFKQVLMLGFGGDGHFDDPGREVNETTQGHFARERALVKEHGAVQDDDPAGWLLTKAWSRPAARRFVDAKLAGVIRPKICPV